MNGFASFAATAFGILTLVDYGKSFASPAQDGEPATTSTKWAAVIIPVLNFIAIIAYIADVSGDPCSTYSESVCVGSDDYFGSGASCFSACVTSISGVGDLNDQCIANGGDANFDCDYGPPGIWVATLVFMIISIILSGVNLLMVFSDAGFNQKPAWVTGSGGVPHNPYPPGFMSGAQGTAPMPMPMPMPMQHHNTATGGGVVTASVVEDPQIFVVGATVVE